MSYATNLPNTRETAVRGPPPTSPKFLRARVRAAVRERAALGRMDRRYEAMMTSQLTREPGLHLVDEEMRSWNDNFDPADVAARRDAIFERSRAQRTASPAS